MKQLQLSLPLAPKPKKVAVAAQGDRRGPSMRLLWFLGVWFPVVLVMVGIFYASSLPSRDIPSLFSFQDIVFHAIIYALLGFSFYRALTSSWFSGTKAAFLLATVIFGTLYGVSDEFHQLFVPGRCCSGLDVLTDVIGSFCGGAAAAFFYHGKNKTV